MSGLYNRSAVQGDPVRSQSPVRRNDTALGPAGAACTAPSCSTALRARAEYTGLVLEATKRMRSNFMLNSNFTLSKAYDMGNNFSTSPNDMRYPDLQMGPAGPTPTVRLVAPGVTYLFPPDAGGDDLSWPQWRRLHVRAGGAFDLNGDGQFNDRVPGFTRNSYRGAVRMSSMRTDCGRSRSARHGGSS